MPSEHQLALIGAHFSMLAPFLGLFTSKVMCKKVLVAQIILFTIGFTGMLYLLLWHANAVWHI